MFSSKVKHDVCVCQEAAQERLRTAHEQRLALEESLERRSREATALHHHNCALRLAANNALAELQVRNPCVARFSHTDTPLLPALFLHLLLSLVLYILLHCLLPLFLSHLLSLLLLLVPHLLIMPVLEHLANLQRSYKVLTSW